MSILPIFNRASRHWILRVTAIIAVSGNTVVHADTIDLMNGAKVEGKVLENNETARVLTIEFMLGGTLTKRTVPYATVHAVTVNGARTILTPKAGAATAKVVDGPVTRSPAEVQALIDHEGGTAPDWLKSTKLNFPKSLDFSWQPQPKGQWNNQVNVGQFVWDIINPNASRWREGVKLMEKVLDANKDDADVRLRATKEMANMHFRFFQDYARAAWWWQKAGVGEDDAAGVFLAECYWRLGGKQMALDLLGRSQFLQLGAIKLLGDMLETDQSLKLAEDYAKADGEPHEAWLLAGDACRLAGRMDDATGYYQKVIATPVSGPRAERMKKVQNRAQANLAAMKLFDLADVKKVRDGTYKDSSLGYEAQVEVSVTVRDQRIESVKVTQHKEKQYYSALTDVPGQIIAKQGVRGVDATSRATITGEAIINATAKALAKGAP